MAQSYTGDEFYPEKAYTSLEKLFSDNKDITWRSLAIWDGKEPKHYGIGEEGAEFEIWEVGLISENV